VTCSGAVSLARALVSPVERAAELWCLLQADAGAALGVAAREEFVVRCGRVRRGRMLARRGDHVGRGHITRRPESLPWSWLMCPVAGAALLLPWRLVARGGLERFSPRAARASHVGLFHTSGSVVDGAADGWRDESP